MIDKEKPTVASLRQPGADADSTKHTNSCIGPLTRSGCNSVLAAPKQSAEQANCSGWKAVPPIHRPIRRLDLTPEAAIALVESFMEEVWAACNPSAVDRFVTEDFVITSAGMDVAGRENFKTSVAGFQSKIADFK